jgi:hypothetical protein
LITHLNFPELQPIFLFSKLPTIKLCLRTLAIFLCLSSHGQYSLEKFDISAPETWYDNSLGRDQSGLLIGEYEEIERVSKNTHQFFGDGYWNSSKISFRGQDYDSAFILYDISKDILLLRHPSNLKFQNSAIRPIQEDISWFIINEHFFKYYTNAITDRPSGFYDEMYNGEAVKLLGKRLKVLKIEAEANYDEVDKFYLVSNGEMKRVYRKRSFYHLFPEHKSAISKYIKQNNLTISVKNEASLISLSRFCDYLITKKSSSQ